MFTPRNLSWHQNGAFVERENFAECVVPTHANNTAGIGDKLLHSGFERNTPKFTNPRDALFETVAGLSRHERTSYNEGLWQSVTRDLVSRYHPIDQGLAIATTTGRHKDPLLDIRDWNRGVRRRPRPLQIAGEPGSITDGSRKAKAGKRIMDFTQAVHKNIIIKVFDSRTDMLALPLGRQRTRFIQNVTQPKDQARTSPFQVVECGFELSPQPQRLLVHDDQIWREALSGLPDERGTQCRRGVDGSQCAKRHVITTAQLDDPRYSDKVDTGLELEAADDWRPGYNQDPQLWNRVGQRMCDRPATPDMAKPETVVAVD